MNNMNEIWKQHPIGIMVSSLGRVETERKGKHYGSDKGNGYLQVGWKGKTYSVHRLICEVFKDNPNNLPCVNHIDENPRNNRADNLEWCTYSYNNTYGTRVERMVKNREIDYKAIAAKIDYKAIAEKRSIPILQLNKDTLEVVREWKSSMEAERVGGYHNGNINSCLNGKLKTHKGFIWKRKLTS